jgi:hypothetical protein
MLSPNNAARQRRAEISRQHIAGEITDLEAGTRLLEADPAYGNGYLMLSGHYTLEGELEMAESYAWQAIQRMPCDPRGYLLLASLRRTQDEADPVALRLMALGCWKVSFQEEVPVEVASFLPAGKADYKLNDPAAYARLAITLDEQTYGEEVPDDRLVPYELLNEIEVEAEAGLEPGLLDRILHHSAALIPLWRAALRQWKESGDAAKADALGMILALLGETAGPEVLGDLMEFADSGDPIIFLHINWAVWRLGQRFPAEVLAALCSADSVTMRCAAAEHILLLPETPGREPALIGLLEGFAEFAKDDDARWLLAAVVGALERLARYTDAERAIRQYQKLLRKDDRRWLMDELDAGFVGRLEDAEIEGLTIDEICSDRMLMQDYEEDGADEEYEDARETEDGEEFDYIPEPIVAPPKPGRNDPCWCGSGKKYKKCHLAADEEAERGRLKM